MKAPQLLACRASRMIPSSAGFRDAIASRGRRIISFSYQSRIIATVTTTEPFIETSATWKGRRRRQHPTSVLNHFISPFAVDGIRTFRSNSNGDGQSSPRKTSGNPSASSMSSSTDDSSASNDGNAGSAANTVLKNATTSDPSMVTWVDDYLPASVRPYAHLSRMDKPIGTWLLLWPCYWSTAMAAGVPGSNSNTTVLAAATSTQSTTSPSILLEVLPDPKLLGLFTLGAFVMRGAGCTINDMWDKDLDRQVARTKTRPLAAGILTPTQALGWLAVQLSAGLGVLVSLPHTMYCFGWGVASLPLVVVYPLMKRFYDYPQLMLGLCFNWGAFMGWAAVHGSMDYSVALPLYMSGVAWTIGYDTLYAHQDKNDDAKLGLKSTAISFGKFGSGKNKGGEEGVDDESQRHKVVLYGLAAATYASWLLAGYNDFVAITPSLVEAAPVSTMPTAVTWLPFGTYALGVTGSYAHLLWQIRTADLNDPYNLAERFRSNAKVGGMVFGSILAGKVAMLV